MAPPGLQAGQMVWQVFCRVTLVKKKPVHLSHQLPVFHTVQRAMTYLSFQPFSPRCSPVKQRMCVWGEAGGGGGVHMCTHLHVLVYVAGEEHLPGYYYLYLRPGCMSAGQIVHVTGNNSYLGAEYMVDSLGG